MTNHLTIEVTEFRGVNQNLTPKGPITWGVRLKDQYDQVYLDGWGPNLPQTHFDTLQQVIKDANENCLEALANMLDDLVGKSVTINGVTYEWDQIQPLFQEALAEE